MQKTPLFHRRRLHGALAAALIAASAAPAGVALRGAAAAETDLPPTDTVTDNAEPQPARAFLRIPTMSDAGVACDPATDEANRGVAEAVLGNPSTAAEPEAVKIAFRLPRPMAPPRRAAEVTRPGFATGPALRLPRVSADELPLPEPQLPVAATPTRTLDARLEMIETDRFPSEAGDEAASKGEPGHEGDGGENPAAAEGRGKSSGEGEANGFAHPDGGLDVHRLAPSRFAAPLPGRAAGSGSG